AVHIRQDVWCHQVTEAHANCPGVLKLLGSADAVEAGPEPKGGEHRVLERTLDAAELTIAKHASNPVAVELPIITETHRSEPAGAARALIDSEGRAAHSVHNVLTGPPQAATAAAENVEAGPARRRGRRRRLDVGFSSKIGRNCRSVKGCQRGQGEQE